MSWKKYTITASWWDLLPNEIQIQLTYAEYELLQDISKKLQKNDIDGSLPILEVEL